ncbi:hypothetical protein SYNPS1DRAFT_26483 [Syncephalis pseudoplumigaleata]|uniref:G-protein coupled receptors family 1 profile domain-containing protein n=1 Tax=Syncephalis pseudoplumigaleata TaxID=1712513 RepID=A0A4P9Z5H8_9FUNG|nr:hypothetical protein SYNPS1DRAFT_26483 [Syncephalis pseudoplumigaleata]|eukprot:RKP27873.1 hypothetical protein SYNPS1DRAFT_26483 [Syncephalis pseudoplumigaleata]
MNLKLRLLCLLVALAPLDVGRMFHGAAGLPVVAPSSAKLFHDETIAPLTPFSVTETPSTIQQSSTTTAIDSTARMPNLSKRDGVKESTIPKDMTSLPPAVAPPGSSGTFASAPAVHAAPAAAPASSSTGHASSHSSGKHGKDDDDDDKHDDDDDNHHHAHMESAGHHLVFNPHETSSKLYFAVVCITGVLNIAACVYVIKHTHPLSKTSKAGEKAAKRQTMLQSAASAVRRTMHNIPAPWMLEQQFYSGRLTKKEREEVRRHEDHKLAFFTTSTDLVVTILVTASIFYSYFADGLVEGLPCEIIGFAVFALLLMDITLVMFECIVMWMSFSQPRSSKPQASTMQSCKRWLLFVTVPWVIASFLFPFEAFGQDEFWCFTQVGHTAGKFAISFTILFHYTVLLVVLMCFIPIMRQSRQQRKYGTKGSHTTLSAHEVAANESNAKHMLVHILHYTPGTLHSIATLSGSNTDWLFIIGVAFVQLGAVMHAVLIWSHERHRRVARERRGTGDTWANETIYRSNTLDSQRTMAMSAAGGSYSQKVLSRQNSNATVPAHLVTSKPVVHFAPPKPAASRPSLLRRETGQSSHASSSSSSSSSSNGQHRPNDQTRSIEEADVEYGDFLNDYMTNADETLHSERRAPADTSAPQRRSSLQCAFDNGRSTYIMPVAAKHSVRKVYTAEPLPMMPDKRWL